MVNGTLSDGSAGVRYGASNRGGAIRDGGAGIETFKCAAALRTWSFSLLDALKWNGRHLGARSNPLIGRGRLCELKWPDVLRLRFSGLSILTHIIRYALTFLEEVTILERRDVNEDIDPPGFRGDETKALVRVEKLNLASRHDIPRMLHVSEAGKLTATVCEIKAVNSCNVIPFHMRTD